MAPAKLRIAVMMEAVQLSDVVGVDILGNLSSEYVTQTADMIPGDWIKFAPEMEFFWLATSLEPAFMTPDMRVVPNCTYDDCPRDLDILLIGGPMPSHRPASADKFMKEAFPKTKVVMTTCIGSMWLASSGVLKGMKATTNRGFLSMAKKIHPEIDWQDQRWVVDNGGKLWTSGGAGAGIDMIAHYALENFDKTFVETYALEPLEFNPKGSKGQFYK